jgi:ABC-type transporter Mla subunit MlaD
MTAWRTVLRADGAGSASETIFESRTDKGAQMGLADRLSQLTKRARDTAAEHKDQVEQTLQKAAAAADQRTGGKYHDQIAKAETKAKSYVENLEPAQPGSPERPSDTEPHAPGGPAK